MNEPIWIKEHELIPIERQAELSDIYFHGMPDNTEPFYLGIDNQYRASYYVGASWLKVGELAVVVMPKMDDLDFIQMFNSALSVDTIEESDYFSRCYGISLDEPPILLNGQNNLLTPLLIIHYISLLERIIRVGIKRGYKTTTENLDNKIKGHVVVAEHLRKNLLKKRSDKTFCRYEEYTEDIVENRLLKKALMVTEHLAYSCESLKKQDGFHDVNMRLNRLKVRFGNVSDKINANQVQDLSNNKLFKEYKEAIRIAKLLLRRFGYAVSNRSAEQNAIPPFWIDMARLYEMYVYGKLKMAYPGQISFQVAGYRGTAVDFVKKDECLIMDTKYKPQYKESNRGIIDDVRQISGYSRDNKILSELGVVDESEVKCIIIYPDIIDDTEEAQEYTLGRLLLPQAQKVSGFRNIYKVKIKLPVIQ